MLDPDSLYIRNIYGSTQTSFRSFCQYWLSIPSRVNTPKVITHSFRSNRLISVSFVSISLSFLFPLKHESYQTDHPGESSNEAVEDPTCKSIPRRKINPTPCGENKKGATQFRSVASSTSRTLAGRRTLHRQWYKLIVSGAPGSKQCRRLSRGVFGMGIRTRTPREIGHASRPLMIRLRRRFVSRVSFWSGTLDCRIVFAQPDRLKRRNILRNRCALGVFDGWFNFIDTRMVVLGNI
ncbi:hypothetical protein GWI33_009530 [Rhynchophorus ferrugineus]|uniref:Uncharacterized protein n=1 Tax=Rhynchophorus ferrugineus TaxID=354439 RepID=A0A834MJ70_RHYFE|nr:hypothetical protein GWI33_009530 [Rhynchophorus ferrugineus]